jgi:hypothetical protein
MAKTLSKPHPSSSVANLLDPDVTARVVARPASTWKQTSQAESQTLTTTFPVALPTTGEIPNIPRQFTLTQSADRTLKRMIDAIADGTGLELRHSELLRAILHAAATAIPELVEESRRMGPLRRPKNDRGREAQRDAVERSVGRAFAAALRAAPAEK